MAAIREYSSAQDPTPFYAAMADTKETLRINVATLMNRHDLTYTDIDRMKSQGKVNITGRFVRQLVQGERGSPGLDKLEELASLFGITAWQLIRPTLARETSTDSVEELIAEYVAATPEGQENIKATAKFAPKRA